MYSPGNDDFIPISLAKEYPGVREVRWPLLPIKWRRAGNRGESPKCIHVRDDRILGEKSINSNYLKQVWTNIFVHSAIPVWDRINGFWRRDFLKLCSLIYLEEAMALFFVKTTQICILMKYCASLNIQMAFQYGNKIHRLISLLSQAEYYAPWKVLNKIDLCSL